MKGILEQLSYMSEYHTDNIAISHRDTSLTYGELDLYSSQLATIIGHSIQPLILYGHMSPFMIVGMIASMKAGNGYVPIDVSLPIERIEHIIEKVEPAFIFNTTGKILNGLHIEQVTIADCVQTEIRLDDIEPIKREQIVYTIFTSGSTGLPKGVQISYESLLDFIQWMTDLNKVGSYKKWLNQAPFSFDLSVMAIYPCLMTGGTLELVDKQMIEKPRELYDLLNQSEVESWVSTPSFLEMCLLLPDFNQDKYPKLKQFFFCGEIFSHKTAQKLLDLYRDATIYNTYGPTEATVAITSVQITQDILDQFNPLPVGTVRPNTEIELTDHGELVIVGKSVSQGYLKDKEKHNKVFKNINGKVHYHTGDKATFSDGYWFIQGRLDFQIKINGYRMELEEIEMILEQLPEVKQAMITPIKNGEKVQYLYATIVLTEMSTINEAELSKQLKAALKLQLPEYMIPRKFRFVEQLPLTVNGKLDRKKVLEEIQS